MFIQFSRPTLKERIENSKYFLSIHVCSKNPIFRTWRDETSLFSSYSILKKEVPLRIIVPENSYVAEQAPEIMLSRSLQSIYLSVESNLFIWHNLYASIQQHVPAIFSIEWILDFVLNEHFANKIRNKKVWNKIEDNVRMLGVRQIFSLLSLASKIHQCLR